MSGSESEEIKKAIYDFLRKNTEPIHLIKNFQKILKSKILI